MQKNSLSLLLLLLLSSVPAHADKFKTTPLSLLHNSLQTLAVAAPEQAADQQTSTNIPDAPPIIPDAPPLETPIQPVKPIIKPKKPATTPPAKKPADSSDFAAAAKQRADERAARVAAKTGTPAPVNEQKDDAAAQAAQAEQAKARARTTAETDVNNTLKGIEDYFESNKDWTKQARHHNELNRRFSSAVGYIKKYKELGGTQNFDTRLEALKTRFDAKKS